MTDDAMPTLVRERSKITAKGQTTVPKAVRQALGVSCGDEIDYVVNEDGRVSLHAAKETDPVIDAFLTFLAQDMARNPERIAAFPADLAERMASLTAGMTVDLAEEVDGDVTL
jgi:antitoxin PrlF